MTPARATVPGRMAAPVVALMAVLSAPAMAQVTVNPDALDAPPAASRPAPSRPAVRPVPSRHAPVRPNAPAGPANPPVAPGQAAVRLAPPSAPPVSPPAPPAVPPAVVVPLSRPQPPPPVPVNDDAPGVATPLPGGGIRVTFGPDRQDLNPATVDAIRAYGAAVRGNDTTALNVMAYAGGKSDDPSTPRRLSLARALAARAVLINDGIPSARIYVRALGTGPADEPADRVDVMPAGAPTPPATPAAAPGPPAAGPARK